MKSSWTTDPQPAADFGVDRLTFRKVRSVYRSTENAVVVTLFENEAHEVCGWYLGPVRIAGDGVSLPYLPRSKGLRASVAVVRAMEAAGAADLDICVVDPDDLWDRAWAA